MTKIQLTQKKWALRDDADVERLNPRKWTAHKTRGGKWYVEGHVVKDGKAKIHFMHRVVVGYYGKKFVVDHINGDGLDNQRHNLRKVTRRQNLLNRFGWKNKRSKYRGVLSRKAGGRRVFA